MAEVGNPAKTTILNCHRKREFEGPLFLEGNKGDNKNVLHSSDIDTLYSLRMKKNQQLQPNNRGNHNDV
jgi:hypothetical protein